MSCRKWVLDPNHGPWAIRGYQMGDDVLEKFRVASIAESRDREINYGNDVGTITMTVFREQKGTEKQKLMDIDEQQETAVRKLAKLPEHAKNYNALKAQLLEDANRSRGLIVEGEREPSKIQLVTFNTDPTPIMSVTIVYYGKQGIGGANGTVDKFGAPKSPNDPGPGAPPL